MDTSESGTVNLRLIVGGFIIYAYRRRPMREASHHEIKGNLARLLASENLTVIHKAVKTASFDVNKRVLTLPIWQGISNRVYDMLVGHEVGHALFTPNRDMTDFGCPQGYVNVTEDARIEKLMKRKFLGLRKDFYEGYKQLHSADFFEIEDRDVNEMSFADRVNLHFKIGLFLPIEFSIEEQHVVALVENAETFEDAVEAARLMWNMRNKPQEETLQAPVSGSEEGQQPESPTDQEGGIEADSEKGNSEPQEPTSSTEEDKEEGDGGEEDVTTQEAFSGNLEDIASESTYEEVHNIDIPNFDIEKVVVDNYEYQSRCREHYSSHHYQEYVELADQEYASYRKKAAREVNYLVKEFECRKSASAYARASVSRTGILDTSKLHTYKYNEDLFKKVTVLPDGKNHGLIALVDWSGSIGATAHNMIKQLLNIAWFCKKVQIPFNAYLFTTEWARYEENDVNSEEPFKYAIGENFHLINVISSDVPASMFEDQLKYLFRMSAYYTAYDGPSPWIGARGLGIPLGLNLGGTPLSDAIVSLHSLIPQFRKTYGVEKLNVIVLTDGEASAGQYTTDTPSYRDEERMHRRRVEHRAALRNRKLGTVYKVFGGDYMSNIKIYLEDVKNTFPDTNIVCFRIIESRDVTPWIRHAAGLVGIENVDTFRKVLQKQKTAIVPKGLGYDAFYLIPVKSLAQDTEFDVADDASKAQLRNAFKRSLTAKAVNKKILSSFAEMVS